MNLINILYFSKRALKFSLLIGIIYSFFYLLRLKKFNKPFVQKNFIVRLIYICYISALIQITIIRDWNSFFNIDNLSYSIATIQYIPFSTMYNSLNNELWTFIYPVFGNMLWFMPLGFISPLINNKFSNTTKLLILSFLFSSSIEILQFIFNSGISDIDDIILNILGALLGYCIYRIYISFKNKKYNKYQNHNY